MTKRILALLVALILLGSLVACGTNPVENPVGDPTDSQTGSSQGDTPMTVPDEGNGQTPGGESNGGNNSDGETPGGETPPADNVKSIDIYLIAGQSNASGYTKVKDASALYAKAPGLENGYSNVHYAGNARSDSGNPNYTKYDNMKAWQLTKLGFGRSDNYFGPEAGMAAALSAYYNSETGKHAGIIKLAHGGTRLMNVTTGSNKNGNWVSPSYAEELGISYVDPVGGLYNALLLEVKTQLGELESYGGFTHVNIKGLYWMQGESDRDYPTEYEKAFKLFVSDLRSDLSDIVKQYHKSNDDGGASQMTVVVGSISETYSSATADSVAKNQTFITMQKGLEKSIAKCYCLDNSQYVINRGDGTTDVVGTDRYHWNQADALDIGVNAGYLLLAACTEYRDTNVEKWDALYDFITNGGGSDSSDDESSWTERL